jgi:hypothetical protein
VTSPTPTTPITALLLLNGMYLVTEVTDAVAYGFNIFLGAVEFHRNGSSGISFLN